MNLTKILIVGAVNNYCLETSYAFAAQSLKFEVLRFDPNKEIAKHLRLGKVGRLIQDFFQPEVWMKKMNRELIVKVKETKPDIILLTGGSKILYGTLVTIKVIHPKVKLVWVWPDTPANLNSNNFSYARILDLSATYSYSTIDTFRSLGFNNVQWVALAGDPSLHWMQALPETRFNRDISFVGMWRPEREKALKVICQKFGRMNIEIYGKYWKRNCKDDLLLSKWKGEGVFAKDLANYFNSTRVNLNIIDDTNFPAANMRFFEIPTAGGLQVCSTCPEFQTEFIEKKEILYFENDDQLVDAINWVINHPNEAEQIRVAGQQKISLRHTYRSRLEEILRLIN